MTELRADVDRMREELDSLTGQISTDRPKLARIEGELAHLVRAYERAASVATSQVLADLEIRKTGQMAEAEAKREARKDRRQLVAKLAATGSGLFAIISAMISAGKC